MLKLRGIDLSHWNGQTGIDLIRDNNIELDFVIAKHSEGGTIMDTWFDRYMSEAKRRRIATAGYHFYVGNNFTSDRRNMIHDRLLKIRCEAGYAFLDWEREVDDINANFIFNLFTDFAREIDGIGLYASYAVLNSTFSGFSGKTVAEVCNDLGISIWCARYKNKEYAPELDYGHIAVPEKMLQRDLKNGIKVDINQITSKCIYNGVEIKLDYNVAFTTNW